MKKKSVIQLAFLLTIAPSAFGQYWGYKFYDLELLRSFSDEDQVKLFRNVKVGKCILNENELIIDRQWFVNEGAIARRFQEYIKSNQKKLANEKLLSDKVIAKSLRDILDDGDCGEYSEEEIKESKEWYPQLLGQFDIGFSYFVDQKTDALELAKMHYPLKKLLSVHKLEITELKAVGYSLGEIYKAGIKIEDLIAEGFNANDLIKGGVPITDLKTSFTIADFKQAGVDARTFKSTLGYSVVDLKASGLTIPELYQGGYGFGIAELKGAFSAADFRESSLFEVRVLKHNGFSINDLKEAGYSAKQLHQSGYGFNLSELKTAFTANEIKESNLFEVRVLKHNGYTANELKNVGYNVSQLHQSGYGFSLSELKAAFTVKEIKDSNLFEMRVLKYNGFNVNDLKEAGYSLSQLYQSGYGFNISELKTAFTAKDIKESNLFDIRVLKYNGFTVSELKKAGYSLSQLHQSGYGFPLSELKGNFSAQELKEANIFSVNQMKSAGFTAKELKEAGYKLRELIQVGYSDEEIDKD